MALGMLVWDSWGFFDDMSGGTVWIAAIEAGHLARCASGGVVAEVDDALWYFSLFVRGTLFCDGEVAGKEIF